MAKTGTILLVDDSPDDVLLIRLALKRTGITNTVASVGDGERAIQYLKGEPPYSDRQTFPLPGLVLLDLAMPRMGGFDFLIWIGKQPELRSIPVVVLTGSALLADAKRAYQLGARSFVTKPGDLTELGLSLKQTTDFWLNHRSAEEPRATERDQVSNDLTDASVNGVIENLPLRSAWLSAA